MERIYFRGVMSRTQIETWFLGSEEIEKFWLRSGCGTQVIMIVIVIEKYKLLEPKTIYTCYRRTL